MTYKDFIEEEIIKELKVGEYTAKVVNWNSAKWTNTEVIINTFKGHKAYYSGGSSILLVSKNDFKVKTKRGITKDIKKMYEEHNKDKGAA